MMWLYVYLMIVYCFLYIVLFSMVLFCSFVCLFFFDNCSTFQFTFTLRINFRAENWSHFPCLALVKRQGQKFTSRMGMFCCCEIRPLWSWCSWRVLNSRLVTEPLPWKCRIGAKGEKGGGESFYLPRIGWFCFSC